ncbi:DUF6308 family protein [Isoptericola sp. 178]|uniref:DUF6308 family protein n=1 Tax=Isoptericola sp. 178 TaxID=3064651 RepID=UPI00271321DE|nr:DUF6308 family protein [Isoptericola sp. 178]MDO8144927.1 DUF6308 family protein [Isoptericola sp. 178]
MTRELPEGWPALEPAAEARAKATALEALGTASLERYYDTRGDYAGATFASISPNDPYDVTGADLHALTMLSVRVGPGATRRVLDDGKPRRDLLEALAELDPNIPLADAAPTDLANAWSLYTTAKDALADPKVPASDPWVTAAKLVARKRPHLLPVRDTKVRALLGLATHRDGRLEIQALRALVTDAEVTDALDWAVEAARERGRLDDRACVFDDEPLRILDAALWMHAVGKP